jgi:glutamate--cysteine ligase
LSKEKLIDLSIEREVSEILSNSVIGIEKETLRIKNKKVSSDPHPLKLGSSLMNQFITTDFSEAQLELITPPKKNVQSALKFLDDIQHFVTRNIGDEVLWPFSMPINISSENEIPIAQFGSSNLGLFKNLYRKGLSHRYGKKMQSISGIHFNFSFADEIWPILNDAKTENELLSSRSDAYFGMLRNLHRMNWLIIYLFGSSPMLPKNLVPDHSVDEFLEFDNDTLYLPYATSLRMSDLGYQNTKRSYKISLNSLDQYIDDLLFATNTVSQDFLNLEKNKENIQISPNIFQIEDEFYSIARAKSITRSNQRPLNDLRDTGVSFIELRSLDLNPFDILGIDVDTAKFLELFLVYCFFKKSDKFGRDSINASRENDLRVSKFGREENIKISKHDKQVNLADWGNEILDEMLQIADLLDKNDKYYSKLIHQQRIKIDSSSETLSAKVLNRMLNERHSFSDFGMMIAEENKLQYVNRPEEKNKIWKLLNEESASSLDRQNELEKSRVISFSDFKANYFV